ncbi:type II secretion system protein GspD [Aquipseudomonas alcaligenes]|uniref:Type II secretion system protein GspD n=1 Tax=Aquipseudomonas alcaligenes TaxID=43263 RepID=A0A2V4KQG8_AQUAC|nr:type II secretion system secretin GspD [Pseudomonas alcaligenes]PYC20204.1 type II secretion system protein GspD [Pseudomonas alcaligenes]
MRSLIIGSSALLLLVHSSFIHSAPLEAVRAQEPWHISLKDVDIKTFIEEVSSLTGETFIVDPRVSGKVTVLSQDPLNKRELLKLFVSTLNAHGFTIIPQGAQSKIAPLNMAKVEASVTQTGEPEHFETRLIKVSQMPAEELIPVLRPLLPGHANISAEKTSNSVIVTDQAANIERIEHVIRSIEEKASSDVSVVSLKYASVTQLLETLNDLAEQISKKGGREMQITADTRSNRLLLSGAAQDKEKVLKVVRQLDIPASRSNGPLVVRLRHGDAKNIVSSIEKLADSLGINTDEGQKSFVTADTQLNAIIVMAPKHHHDSIQSLIEKLDVSRAQVMVEAAIVEVSGDISEALGVQWAIDGRGNGTAGAGGVNFSDTGLSVGTVLKAIDEKKVPTSLPNGAIIGVGNDNFGALVTALSSNSNTNLLSTPSLLTLDNQEAEILVGQNVPFQTGSYATSGSGVANPFQTIERKDVGVTLKVTPHINDGEALRMDIVQEISSIAPTAQNVAAVDLITNKRAIKSTVMAKNGEVIVLGGLIQDDITQSVSKVPLLGSIPFIGALFRSTKDVHIKRNLLVLIRPSIIRDEQTLADISEQKYQNIRVIGEQKEAKESALPGKREELFDKAPNKPAESKSEPAAKVFKAPDAKPLTQRSSTSKATAPVHMEVAEPNYVIQLMSGQQRSHLEKIIERNPNLPLLIEERFLDQQQPIYSLVLGYYKSQAQAQDQIAIIPAELKAKGAFIRPSR